MQQPLTQRIKTPAFWYFASAAVLFPFIYSQLQRLVVTIGAQIIITLSPTREVALDTWYRNIALLNILPGVVYLLLVVGFVAAIRHTKFHLPGQFALNVSFGTAAKSFLAGITLFVSTVFVFSFIPQSQQAQYDYAERMAALTSSPWIFQFIFTVIMAPVVEEVAYRAGMFACAKKIMPVKAALVLQAVAFGVLHLDFGRPPYFNYQQGLYAAVLGLLMGIIYHRTRSLTAVTIVHMSFNASNYYILPLLRVLGEFGQFGGLLLLAAFPGSIVASVFLIAGKRKLSTPPSDRHW